MTSAPRVGPYELVAELGRGGMGVVYRARHVALGAERAVKVLVALGADPATLARFRLEAEALARVGGEGIVPVHESGAERGRLWYAMALVPGGSLRGRLAERGRLEWRDATRLVARVSRAVGRCHRAGLVHRDLKPENVLLDLEGRPWVADFGLARDLAGPRLTETGMSLGTPAYMPPEQHRAESVDARADVFALGAILHELVLGARPFEGKSHVDVYQRTLAQRRAPLTSVRGVPRALEEVVARALRVDPAERFADADALAAALETVDRPGGRRAARRVAVATVLTAGALAVALPLWSRRARSAEAERLALEALALVADEALAPSSSATVAAVASEAVLRAERALALDPRSLDALEARARARRRSGDPAAAVADATRLIELAPERAAAWYERGVARDLATDHAGAIEDLTRAVELDPRGAVALVARARALTTLHKLDRAILDANRALDLAPGLVDAYLARGEARMSKGDSEAKAAVADFTKAIELAPRLASAYAGRCGARHGSGDDAGARLDADRAIELGPDLEAGWQARALLRRDSPDPAEKERALADATIAITLAPRSPESWDIRGGIDLYTGRLTEAASDFTRAIELDPRRSDSFANRAMIHYELAVNRGSGDDALAAIADATHAIELDPESAQCWVVRGIVRGYIVSQWDRGALDGAIVDLTRALALMPQRADVWAHRASVRARKGDRGGQIADLTRGAPLETGGRGLVVRPEPGTPADRGCREGRPRGRDRGRLEGDRPRPRDGARLGDPGVGALRTRERRRGGDRRRDEGDRARPQGRSRPARPWDRPVPESQARRRLGPRGVHPPRLRTRGLGDPGPGRAPPAERAR